MFSKSTIWHKFSNNKALISFINVAKQLHKISVINFGQEFNFTSEFSL